MANHVAWLTLNRPEAMNALSETVLDQLNEAFTAVEDAPAVRVVVLTGSGSAFCTGADLKGLLQPDGSIDPDGFMEFVRYVGTTVERIPRLGKPVIAAINGYALAGGLELALACDMVVASRSAHVGDAHANYGLVPGAGGAARLPRIIPPMVARYLAFTGDSLPAAELVPLGFVNEVVDDDRLTVRVSEICARIAEKSAPGIAQMKHLINDGLQQPLATALIMEQEMLKERLRSEDLHEGLAAFRERRKPRFTDEYRPPV